MESKMALKRDLHERGQAIMLFAVLISLMALFTLGILDYMVTNLRIMETVAAADLAAHAGAQIVQLRPDGLVQPRSAAAAQMAANYFYLQAPDGAQLNDITCGLRDGKPACAVSAKVTSTGYLLPEKWIRVDALGFLAFGVTRPDQ